MLPDQNPAKQNQMHAHNLEHNHTTMLTSGTPKPQHQGLMKFVIESKDQFRGRRCFSKNNAVSRDSPQHFHISRPANPNINKVTTYRQRHPNPQIPKTASMSFNPHKNYFNISQQNQTEPYKEYLNEYNEVVHRNKHFFNKKISDDSLLVQHNVFSQWGQQYPLMGSERTKESRRLDHVQRSKIVQEKKKNMEVFLKTFQTKMTNTGTGKSLSRTKESGAIIRNNNDLLFVQRVKLRQSRNQIANKLHSNAQSYRNRQQQEPSNLKKTFYSAQISSFNKYQQSRPFTQLKSRKSIISNRHQMFDCFLNQFGGTNEQESRRPQTMLRQRNDVSKESQKQMVRQMQVWDQGYERRKFSPCQSSLDRQKISSTRKQETPKTLLFQK